MFRNQGGVGPGGNPEAEPGKVMSRRTLGGLVRGRRVRGAHCRAPDPHERAVQRIGDFGLGIRPGELLQIRLLGLDGLPRADELDALDDHFLAFIQARLGDHQSLIDVQPIDNGDPNFVLVVDQKDA